MEKLNKTAVKAICLILFVFFLGLVVIGQRQPGYFGIAQMMVGIAGLLALLFFYNWQNK